MADAKAEADAKIRTEINGEAVNEATIRFQENRVKLKDTKLKLAQRREEEEA